MTALLLVVAVSLQLHPRHSAFENCHLEISKMTRIFAVQHQPLRPQLAAFVYGQSGASEQVIEHLTKMPSRSRRYQLPGLM